MFSVYGVSGQVFRGTLEHLIQVRGVLPGRNARGIAQEGEELGTEVRVLRGKVEQGPERYRTAADAYARMVKFVPERGPIYHAYQVMSREVMTLRPEAPVEQAWHALSSRGVGQAPVLDAEHRLQGLVSTADLLKVLNVEAGTLRDVLMRTAGEVMTSPVVSTDPITDIRRVAQVLLDYSLPAVPVVSESGELLGIISRGDILRTVVADPPLSLWA